MMEEESIFATLQMSVLVMFGWVLLFFGHFHPNAPEYIFFGAVVLNGVFGICDLIAFFLRKKQ